MIFNKTKIDGLYIIEPDVFSDERGSLIKPFHKETFIKNGLDFIFEESLYTLSKKGVLKGMHFQSPPKDQSKLVYVQSGAILDVILDIRKKSPTYGQYISVELSDKNHKMVYLPEGCAHGFLSLEDNSCVGYLQSKMLSKTDEGGVRLDSFGMDWGVKNPIISTRDQAFPALEDFKTPFI